MASNRSRRLARRGSIVFRVTGSGMLPRATRRREGVKAALVIVAGDAPRVHALRNLIAELQAVQIAVPSEVVMHASYLDQFYMPTRYPDALGDIDPYSVYNEKQSREALEAPRLIVEWCTAFVNKPN